MHDGKKFVQITQVKPCVYKTKDSDTDLNDCCLRIMVFMAELFAMDKCSTEDLLQLRDQNLEKFGLVKIAAAKASVGLQTDQVAASDQAAIASKADQTPTGTLLKRPAAKNAAAKEKAKPPATSSTSADPRVGHSPVEEK